MEIIFMLQIHLEKESEGWGHPLGEQARGRRCGMWNSWRVDWKGDEV